MDDKQREKEIDEALDAAELALSSYHNPENGDRDKAIEWLLKAYRANNQKWYRP